MSKPRPYRVYKRTLAHHRYVGCFATYEAAEREARIIGGYVSVRSVPTTVTASYSAAASLPPTNIQEPT